jgi:signal transduction histidine kinase
VTLESAPGQGTTATLRFPAPGLAGDPLAELRP